MIDFGPNTPVPYPRLVDVIIIVLDVYKAREQRWGGIVSRLIVTEYAGEVEYVSARESEKIGFICKEKISKVSTG